MTTETDIRYEWVTCANCGRAWNRIDFGCEMHGYFCNNPVPLPEPSAAAPSLTDISVGRSVAFFFALTAFALLSLLIAWHWVRR